MKAYVCTVGEKTTDICVWQLQRLGFEVVLLDKVEYWAEKYKKFIKMACRDNQTCLRIDADVILNKNIKSLLDMGPYLMKQFSTYCLYKNDVNIGQPVLYSQYALEIINKNLDKISEYRPEATAWRLKEINSRTRTETILVGMHGFFQDDKTMSRAESNKICRGQIVQYDFKLANKLRGLK